MGHSLDDLYDLIGLALSMLKSDAATFTTIKTYMDIIEKHGPEGFSFYENHCEFNVGAFLSSLGSNSRLTPEERDARAKTRATLQLVQAIMTAVDRTCAVLHNDAIFQCHRVKIEELIYDNNLAHLCLAIEVLNWFAMKNDGNKPPSEILASWVQSGCSRAFVSRFGKIICDHVAFRNNEPFEEVFGSFMAKWAKKDAEKYAAPVSEDGERRTSLDGIYADLEVAMGKDSRTLDAIIRIANHGDVSKLWERFPSAAAGLCNLVFEVRVWGAIAADEWVHDTPAHVETVEDVSDLIGSFDESRVKALVENIVDRASSALPNDPSYHATFNHYNALMSAVKNLSAAKPQNN